MTFQDRLDLKKRFPGYFNVWVFRGAFILLACVLIYAGLVYGFSQQARISCPDDGFVCVNPLYACVDPGVWPPSCTAAEAAFCDDFPAVCARPTLSPGESVGPDVPGLVENFSLLFFLVLAGAFGLNHLLYWRKKNI